MQFSSATKRQNEFSFLERSPVCMYLNLPLNCLFKRETRYGSRINCFASVWNVSFLVTKGQPSSHINTVLQLATLCKQEFCCSKCENIGSAKMMSFAKKNQSQLFVYLEGFI